MRAACLAAVILAASLDAGITPVACAGHSCTTTSTTTPAKRTTTTTRPPRGIPDVTVGFGARQ